jgi:sugar/nucleoside kinase (ribokinase family)
MNRYFRVIPGFNEWAQNLDIIQVNESELFTLSDKKIEWEIIAEIFTWGIKYLIVTLGDRGAKVFYMETDVLKYFYEPAINININNKVGCGDVFGASFFYNYIATKEKNIEMILRKANTAAGFAASYKDIREFKKLKNDVSSRFN